MRELSGGRATAAPVGALSEAVRRSRPRWEVLRQDGAPFAWNSSKKLETSKPTGSTG